MSKEIKFTEREKMIMDMYKSVIETKEEKIKELELIIALNKPYFKYNIRKIKT